MAFRNGSGETIVRVRRSGRDLCGRGGRVGGRERSEFGDGVGGNGDVGGGERGGAISRSSVLGRFSCRASVILSEDI